MILPKGGISLVGLLSVALLLSLACGQKEAESPSVTVGEAVKEAEDPSVTVGEAVKEAEGPSATVGEAVFDMEVAQTPEERGRGLSGRDGLEPGSGMLFIFRSETTTSFWMKGMRFPIDFVWIGAGCTVIDVTLGASAPPPGTADSALPLYTPSAPILYALEINAGEVAELGIEVGDPVAFIDFPADGTRC